MIFRVDLVTTATDDSCIEVLSTTEMPLVVELPQHGYQSVRYLVTLAYLVF